MCDGNNISESSDGPHSFEIISTSGNIIYRPDDLGVSVSIEADMVITRDSFDNPQEAYKVRPGERVRFI